MKEDIEEAVEASKLAREIWKIGDACGSIEDEWDIWSWARENGLKFFNAFEKSEVHPEFYLKDWRRPDTRLLRLELRPQGSSMHRSLCFNDCMHPCVHDLVADISIASDSHKIEVTCLEAPVCTKVFELEGFLGNDSISYFEREVEKDQAGRFFLDLVYVLRDRELELGLPETEFMKTFKNFIER